MQNPQILKVKKGFAYERSGYIIKGFGRTIYATPDEAQAAAAAMPEPVRRTAPAAPTQAHTQSDRSADRVARLAGLPAAPRTGRCHYCNLPLTNGHCEECV